MKYSDIVEALEHATTFDIYRLHAALSRMLDDPERIKRIKDNLRIGDIIEYYVASTNSVHKAKLLKIKRTNAHVENIEDNKIFVIPIFFINLDSVETKIVESKKQGLGRNEVAIGEIVGFVDNQGHEHYGEVIRLNPKTVTINSEVGQWRVAYCFLFKVLNQAADELPPQT